MGLCPQILIDTLSRWVYRSRMEKHFVEFFSPGTFVSEVTQRPIDSWNADVAIQLARGITERYGATPYGFQFITRSREDSDLDSRVTKRSGTYYLGGTVETLEQVKDRATEADRILVSNMEGNGMKRIITNTNSWKFTGELKDDDVVLEWTQPKPKRKAG